MKKGKTIATTSAEKETQAADLADFARKGRMARGAARAAAHATADRMTVEHAREAARKYQGRVLLTMRQMIMLTVAICNRILEMTARFTKPELRDEEYAQLYRREVKKAINDVERAVKVFRGGVLLGVDDEWRPEYASCQEVFDSEVVYRDMYVCWYSLRNALLKNKFEFPNPLIDIYFCMCLLDILSINTDWRKEELHKLDQSFDLTFRWSVFDDAAVRKRMKMLLFLLTPPGCKDASLPLYPDEFPYSFMDQQPMTKTACDIFLRHVNDVDRIVMCLIPEEVKQHRGLLSELRDWLDEHGLEMSMENADGWKRESATCLEGRAVARVQADFETRRRIAAEQRRPFDPVETWRELAAEAEAEWKKREEHYRACDQQWSDALRRLHEDWPEERLKEEEDLERQSETAIVVEPRIEVLRERLRAVAPEEVIKAEKKKQKKQKKHTKPKVGKT